MYADDNNFEYGFCLIFAFLLCDNLLNVLHNYCFLGFTFRPLSNILLILVLSLLHNFQLIELLQIYCSILTIHRITIILSLKGFCPIFFFSCPTYNLLSAFICTRTLREFYTKFISILFFYIRSHTSRLIFSCNLYTLVCVFLRFSFVLRRLL